jgi:type IV pilus assembly protein PilB
MVGEVRDGETADLAVQAALTGHLVFTTLHTNNAATCLPRLLDMGVEPFLIASTVRVIVGQRLVRRLCVVCRQPYVPDAAVIERIKHAFNMSTTADLDWIHKLEMEAIAAGIGSNSTAQVNTGSVDNPSTGNNVIQKLWKAHDQGCNMCNHTGYLGRMGIYEVLSNSEGIQKLIINNTTSENLEAQAIKDGMIKMQTDGLIKALRGETTIEEIMRVTSVEA